MIKMGFSKKILCIIPAKSKSKGIPQKNLRFLNKKPLIYYPIRNAKYLSRCVDNCDIFVTTDDLGIQEVALLYGVKVIPRPSKLADDRTTLDEVVAHALNYLESNGFSYDIVITLQPTSPLLKPTTLQNAFFYFLKKDLDTLISVTPKYHLMWKKEGEKFCPLFSQRVNRQFLTPIFQENGAFIICNADVIKQFKTRIGKKIDVFPISEEEGIDIDTFNDFALAELILQRKNIGLVVNGDRIIGLGHIYRAITLSKCFSSHKCLFFSNKQCKIGIEKLRSLNYQVIEYKDTEELLRYLKENQIDIVINDILDTDAEYIGQLIKNGFFVVNFEDRGLGARKAHLVINALFEWSGTLKNHFLGHKYECLREDIYLFPVKKKVRSKVEKILICFGGTDPSDLSYRLTKLLLQYEKWVVRQGFQIVLILGFGYSEERKKRLLNLIEKSTLSKCIKVVTDVTWMAPYIFEADIAIIANGRMVYEVVALGTPLIVIGQNIREAGHTFAAVHPAIRYLGIASEVSDQCIINTIIKLVENYSLRQQLNKELQEVAKEIRKGLYRVSRLILDKYEDWKDQGNDIKF